MVDLLEEVAVLELLGLEEVAGRSDEAERHTERLRAVVDLLLFVSDKERQHQRVDLVAERALRAWRAEARLR